MEIEVTLVKSFTKMLDQGNPAGVVLNQLPLSTEQMQKIASDIGFSETVFVRNAKNGYLSCLYFTPTQQVDFCGHATTAAFSILGESARHQGKTVLMYVSLRTGEIRKVWCHPDGFVEMEQGRSEFIPYTHSKKIVAYMLGISEHELGDHPMHIVSTGTPKLIVPINSLESLMNIRPRLEDISIYCEQSGARGVYPFCAETIYDTSDFHARQFNPIMGIDEDPVTGVAAGALGVYIKRLGLSLKSRFIIEQGHILNKLGKMYVRIVNNRAKVGGYAVVYGEKIIQV